MITAHMKRLIRCPLWVLAGSFLAVLSARPLHAQPAEAFALHDGDRVVWVGDGLIERAQHDGSIELALTTRWPNRTVTFRNVGWSGDTVFGEARDHYTNPPTPFEHLIEQINTPRPTVIVFGYGGTLAYEGPEALPAFIEGYHLLLDTLGVTGARCVLLSPIPHEQRASPHPQVERLNARLKEARDAIAEVATARGCWFVDLFDGLQEQYRNQETPLTTNGVHLNEAGYRALAVLLEHALTATPRPAALVMDVSSGLVEGGSLQGDIDQGGPSYRFALIPDTLPADDESGRPLRIAGLPEGTYTLRARGEALHTASAQAWSEGILIHHPAERAQVEALRRAILEKNQLYFRQYRPQNETYLVGFRKYEQGQNAAELGLLDPLIDELENQIGRLRVPRVLVFTLTRE